MDQRIEMQSRMKSPIFWIGMVAAVYEAVINSLVQSGVSLPVWMPALGIALATVLIYCNGNNPSLTVY
ncbi:MAG: hypothetical protein II412_06210 [Clostridia bacterium]|nr:hypothetical protein [Clostridia bacterium]